MPNTPDQRETRELSHQHWIAIIALLTLTLPFPAAMVHFPDFWEYLSQTIARLAPPDSFWQDSAEYRLAHPAQPTNSTHQTHPTDINSNPAHGDQIASQLSHP